MEQLGRISRRHGVTRYHQLYTYLRRAVTEGIIAAGSALPSETELMKQYQVSRNTVRRAIARLEDERLVVRRQGSGTYARSTKDFGLATEKLALLMRDARAFVRETVTRVLQFDSVPTPESILRRWPQFSPRSLLIYRTRSHDGDNFLLTMSYVHDARTRGLTRKRLGNSTVLSALGSLGNNPVNGTSQVTASAADSIMARHLDVADGEPLLRVEGITNNGAGEPLEYHVHIFRPDRFRLEFPSVFEPSADGQLRSSTTFAHVFG